MAKTKRSSVRKARACLAWDNVSDAYANDYDGTTADERSAGRGDRAFQQLARKNRIPLPRDYDDCRPLTASQTKKAGRMLRQIPITGFYLRRSR